MWVNIGSIHFTQQPDGRYFTAYIIVQLSRDPDTLQSNGLLFFQCPALVFEFVPYITFYKKIENANNSKRAQSVKPPCVVPGWQYRKVKRRRSVTPYTITVCCFYREMIMSR